MISYCSIKLKKRKIIASIFTRKKNKREWFLISQDIIFPPFTFVFSSNQKGKKYLSFYIPSIANFLFVNSSISSHLWKKDKEEENMDEDLCECRVDRMRTAPISLH